MSCTTLKLKGCEIAGSTFNDRRFNFTNRYISGDIFTMKVRRMNSVIKTISGQKIGNDVVFSFSDIESYRADRYIIEYWAEFEGLGNEMIAMEEFLISATPCNCSESSNESNFTLNFPTENIDYSVNFSITKIGENMTDLEVKEAYERNSNTNAFTDNEKAKLSGLVNYNDSSIIQSLQTKVDKVSGKQLSSNDYTTAEKEKLAGIESNKFKGKFSSLEALQLITDADEGSYAYVGNEGEDDRSYIWDDDDNKWVLNTSLPNSETPASIKTKYESNPDTNAFTDEEKNKLSSLHNYNDSSIVDSLQNKVDKLSGKQLSSNDYTDEEKNNLSLLFNGIKTKDLLITSSTIFPVTLVPEVSDKIIVWMDGVLFCNSDINPLNINIGYSGGDLLALESGATLKSTTISIVATNTLGRVRTLANRYVGTTNMELLYANNVGKSLEIRSISTPLELGKMIKIKVFYTEF